jgi:hypothetical protein
MAYSRALLVPADAPGSYHCVSRCVRRVWLCGREFSGRGFEHRSGAENRIKELAELFAVAVHGYAVMSNYFHVVLNKIRRSCIGGRMTKSLPAGQQAS